MSVAADRTIELNTGNSVYLRTSSTAIDITGGFTVSGITTHSDNVVINKDKDLIFDRFGTTKTRIRYNDTLVATQIYNLNDNLEIGYRPVKLNWLSNTVLQTKLGGINVTGDTETDTLNVSGISTFTGNIHVVNSNIGIGTTNPTAPLHISGADAASARLRIEDNNNNIAASEINVQNGGRDLRIASPVDTFFQKVSGGTPLLYLENGQNVGIATDNPSATLDVFGSTKLRNGVDIDGHTELDNLNVSGVSTFTGNCSFAGNNVTMTASGSPNSLNVAGTSRFEIASIENAEVDLSLIHI